MPDPGEASAALAPFLPRLHREWLATPDTPRWKLVDGSLLFLDISGFTPLTERLVRRGKAGGEELTEHLNGVFGPLIELFAAHGGDVLKFGGDALLVLFDGEAHERRAAAAAWSAQSFVRAGRRLETSAGIAYLDASAGVAAGPVLLALGGTAPTDLLVVGETVTAVLDAESQADAGQVILGERVAAALDPRDSRQTDAGPLLTRAPEAPAAPPPSDARVGDPRLGIPAILHHELAFGAPGEHRLIVVAFLQFRGLDDLIAAQGPAAAVAALDALLAETAAACSRYEITFVTTDADRAAGKILLVAGAPSAHEDDADRMLRALAEIVAVPRPFAVRAGVNRGRGFMTNLGGPARCGWTVMGDATNLAARIMGRAADGTVVASAALLETLRDPVSHTPLLPFRVKGKSDLVQASVLTAAGDALATAPAARLSVRPEDGAEPPGRTTEADLIDEALRGAAAGAQTAIELRGPAGIGKSRLVRCAIARANATGMEVFVVEGGRYGRHAAYLALRTPLRALLGIEHDTGDAAAIEAALQAAAAAHVDAADDWAGLLGPLVGLDLRLSPRAERLDPSAARERRHFAGAELIRGLLGDGPALLVFEDAQWIDQLTGQLLVTLAASAPGGWALVSGRRPGDDGLVLAPALEPARYELGPLAPDVVRRLILGTVDRSVLTPDAVPALVERAAGNPLLLEGLTAALADGGAIDALPDNIEAALAVEIDRLPAADRRALRELSVLGRWIPVRTATAFLGVDSDSLLTLAGRVGALVDHDDDAIWFRRGLQRDAAYEALSFRSRTALHARAADVLQERGGTQPDEDLEVLALHAHHAARPADAWRWCRRAGERALDRGAPADAIMMFDWATQAADHLPEVTPAERSAVLELRGDAADRAGRYEDAARAYGAARRSRAGEPLAVAELCRKQARMLERQGRYSQALAWATRGRRAVAGAPEGSARDAVLGRLDDVSGTSRLRQGRAKQAVVDLERAVERLEQAGNQMSPLAHASYMLAGAYVELGRIDEARAPSERALALYEAAGDLAGAGMGLNNMGIDDYWTGAWVEAADKLERGRLMRSELGDVALTAESELNLAELRSDQGRWDEAHVLLADAVAIFRAAPRPEGVGLALSDLGRLAARRGDTAAAAALLAEARQVLREINADGLAHEVDVREAERLVHAGEPEAALAAAQAVREDGAGVAAAHFYRCALRRTEGWALAQLGRPGAAEAALREALDLARDQDSRYEQAVTWDALAWILGAAPGGEEARTAADALLTDLDVVQLAHPPGAAAA